MNFFYDNPKRGITINILDLFIYVEQLHLFMPLVEPLDHVDTIVENTVAQGWSHIGRISSTN